MPYCHLLGDILYHKFICLSIFILLKFLDFIFNKKLYKKSTMTDKNYQGLLIVDCTINLTELIFRYKYGFKYLYLFYFYDTILLVIVC